jgi:hypothetical protein
VLVGFPLGIGHKRPHRGILSALEERILLGRGAAAHQWQRHRYDDDEKPEQSTHNAVPPETPITVRTVICFQSHKRR